MKTKKFVSKFFTIKQLKSIAVITLSLNCISMFSQGNGNGPRWSPSGNTASTGDFLGTMNAFPLPIKTNNITRFTFDTNGDLIFNSLANGTSNRLMTLDATGKLSALSGTSLNNLFSSNGIGVLQKSGNDYYLPTGNLGIGIAPSSAFKLDVIGDARISNNLYVGGGIVITDQVQAATQIKGLDFKVDNSLNVTGASNFTGTATFGGKLALGGSGSTFGISYNPPSGNSPSVINFGNLIGIPVTISPCSPFYDNPPTVTQFGNLMQVYNTNGGNNYLGGPILDIGAKTTENYLNSRLAPLSINADCGSNVNIVPTGAGDVGIGGNAQNGLKLGVTATNIGFCVNTVHPADYNYNTKLYVNRNNSKAIGIFNTVTNSSGDENFVVYGDGRTAIGGNYIPFGYKLAVEGTMIAEEVVIRLRPNWPDYVFKKDYKLMPLLKVEEFIKNNSHLPNIPSDNEIQANGLQTGEMISKQMEKIEELTLYLIELKKEIEILKAENKEIKKQIK